ncbi:MAG: UDP-N-acetylmuramate--L-alanine ligase [Candidatus Paceibacterota bacterium]
MSTKIDLENIKKVHCVGIGGIGLSAVARLFHGRGAGVSGSDMNESPVTDGLREINIDVSIGHDTANLPADADLVVHTIAVPADNPELIAAKKGGIPVLTYPETLGLLSENMYTVAVSGTHGKTTTTAMLAEILLAAGKDPTVIVGSLLHAQKSNFIGGQSNILVVEACEYRRSFLHLHPDILVITNVDTDHLDYFDDLADIQQAFTTLVAQLADDGVVVCDPQADNLAPVIAAAPNVIDFTGITLDGELEVPGEHNRQNGRAAIAAAEELSVSHEEAVETVRKFAGTWRRAQKKGECNGAFVYDDYGHHPTEVRSTLEGFRQRFPDRRLVVAFQPHLYSRTKEFMDEFADSLSLADVVILLPIYAARELSDPAVSSDILAKMLADRDVSVQLAADFDQATEKLTDLADDGTLILTQGAGDIYKVADNLIKS